MSEPTAAQEAEQRRMTTDTKGALVAGLIVLAILIGNFVAARTELSVECENSVVVVCDTGLDEGGTNGG